MNVSGKYLKDTDESVFSPVTSTDTVFGSDGTSLTDLLKRTGDSLPIGTVLLWPGNTVPTGWLLCNGAAVSRTTYATLFAAIGTLYGSGDGSTTFNVPNFQGKIPIGDDDGTITTIPTPTSSTTSSIITIDAEEGETLSLDSDDGDVYIKQNYIIKANTISTTQAELVSAKSTASNTGYTVSYINNLTKASEITIATSSWVLNSTTNLYEYTVTDSSITANHLVECYMDLDNQVKMTDGYTSSYNGGYKIITSVQPTSSVTMTVKISLVA